MSTSAVRLFLLSVPALVVLACETPQKSSGPDLEPSPQQSSAGLTTLGTAESFSVLGGSTVTNTGPTLLSGNLGVYPGSAITGFPPGQLAPPATIHAADAVAAQAQLDLGIAYDALAAQACSSDMSGVNLGGQTLSPGVYCFSSEALLTGTLVLDAQLNPNAVFVFKITSALTTASNATVALTNGANPCNVFWQVGSSATIGTGTSFTGDLLALTSIALQSGANLSGRALARNGAVTLDSNQIRSNVCSVAVVDGGVAEADAGSPNASDAGSPNASDAGSSGTECCAGTVACGGTCVDLQCDSNNCGACGNVCASDEVCTAGACAAHCP